MEKNRANRPVLLVGGIVALAVLMLFFMTKTGDGQNRLTNEQQLANLLSEIHGVGQVQVYFHYEEQQKDNQFLSVTGQDKLTGVIIVAQGATNAEVRILLKETIGNVLQIPTHRIQVVPMQNKEESK